MFRRHTPAPRHQQCPRGFPLLTHVTRRGDKDPECQRRCYRPVSQPASYIEVLGGGAGEIVVTGGVRGRRGAIEVGRA